VIFRARVKLLKDNIAVRFIKRRSTMSTSAQTDVPAVVDVPAADAPAPDAVKVLSVDAVVSEKFDQINQQVTDLTAALRVLQINLKTAQKELVKLVKANVKKTKSKTGAGAKKTASGFAKPTKLSPGLCDFLGVPHDTEFARTEVTRRINTYIKEKNLQDPADKRIIHPDEALSKILDLSILKDKALSFFNVQSCLKSNFIKV
jgi:chromatin remodeling complex protein RSC6